MNSFLNYGEIYYKYDYMKRYVLAKDLFISLNVTVRLYIFFPGITT